MLSFGQRAQGERLERMGASPLWTGEGFRNQHPVLPGLRQYCSDSIIWFIIFYFHRNCNGGGRWQERARRYRQEWMLHT